MNTEYQMQHDRRILIIRALCLLLTMLVLCLAIASAMPAKVYAAKRKKPALSVKKERIQTGRSFFLKVRRASGKRVSWSVSDANILTVKKTGKYKCRVTGISTGTATVTAKIGRRKLTCKVTVFAPAKRKPVYTGDANLDYLLERMCQDAGITADMSDEQIAYGAYKWIAHHAVYDFYARKP